MPYRNDRFKIQLSSGFLSLDVIEELHIEVRGPWDISVCPQTKTFTRIARGLCTGVMNTNYYPTVLQPVRPISIDHQIAESWVANLPHHRCYHFGTTTGLSANPTPVNCPSPYIDRVQSMDYCGMISDPTGRYSTCHPRVPIGGYYDACLRDVCMSMDSGDARIPRAAVCNLMEALSVECNATGAHTLGEDVQCCKFVIVPHLV